MRRCLSCHASFEGHGHAQACPLCHQAVPHQDGVPCYAPDLAYGSSGFRAETFAWLAEREESHFWFRARSELIAYAVRTWFPRAKTLLEIGCGTGYVLRSLQSEFPDLRCSGSEIFLEGLRFAGERLPDVDLFQMDARHIPYRGQFDLIGAFDVIEHIEEDEEVLDEVRRALVPGGGALFTVPQHPALWSAQDERACHKRRYRRGELEDKLRRAGFDILMSTSFVSLLLPLLFLSRKKKRAEGEVASGEEFALSPRTNSLLYGVLRLERTLIQAGMRLPAGGTRLVVARARPGQASATGHA